MEDKLESYRLRKRRTEAVQSIKEKFFGMITSAAQYLDTKVDIDVSELVVMEISLKSVFVIQLLVVSAVCARTNYITNHQRAQLKAFR
jgi:hypothetical protein